MSGYFLLRDNKKNGPFSLNDLYKLGVRDTDLFWIDQVSTCWKSPAEIDELAHYVSSAKKPSHLAEATGTHELKPLHEHFNNPVETIPAQWEPKPRSGEPSTPAVESRIKSPQTESSPYTAKESNRPFTTLREAAAKPITPAPAATVLGQNLDNPSKNPDKVKVIIADDHTLFREGVKLAMASRTDIQMIGEAATGAQLLTLLQTLTPDIILLDIQMPVMDGIEALKAIRKKHGAVKVIMLSMHEDPSMISTLLQAGANAYLSKTDDSEMIYTAIKTCHEKEFFFNDRANRAMLQQLRSTVKKKDSAPKAEFDGAELMLKLTHAQKRLYRRQLFSNWKHALIGLALGLTGLLAIGGIGYLIYENLEIQFAPPPQQPAAARSAVPVQPLEVPGLLSQAEEIVGTTAAERKIDPIASDQPTKELTTKATRNKTDKPAKKEPEKLLTDASAGKPEAVQPVLSAEPSAPAVDAEREAKAAARSNIYNLVSASVNEYKKGTLGGLSDIRITVYNRSSYSLNQVRVVVEYLLPNDKVFKTETLEFSGLGPSASATLEAPKSQRGVRLQYRIAAISSQELGL